MKRFWTLFIITVISYVCGILFPMLILERGFGIFSNEQSIITGLVELIDHNEYILFMIIALFSVLFPIIKLSSLGAIARTYKSNPMRCERWLHWLEEAGRWSMLDVFVVALLVVFVKLGSLADVKPRIGLIFFTISAVLAMFSSAWLKRIVRNHRETEIDPA